MKATIFYIILLITFSTNAIAYQKCYLIRELKDYSGVTCVYQCADGSLIDKKSYGTCHNIEMNFE